MNQEAVTRKEQMLKAPLRIDKAADFRREEAVKLKASGYVAPVFEDEHEYFAYSEAAAASTNADQKKKAKKEKLEKEKAEKAALVAPRKGKGRPKKPWAKSAAVLFPAKSRKTPGPEVKVKKVNLPQIVEEEEPDETKEIKYIDAERVKRHDKAVMAAAAKADALEK